MLWVLIRITLAQQFWWVPATFFFSNKYPQHLFLWTIILKLSPNSLLFCSTVKYRNFCKSNNWAIARQNQHNDLYALRRLKSAWASAQSDQSSDQPGHLPSLIRVFTVCMKKPWVLSYPLSSQRTLIRLGRCPGWSESSLGAQTILLVLSCCGSNGDVQWVH